MKQEFYKQDKDLIVTHYGEEYEQYYNAITPPIFMNTLNVFDSVDNLSAYDRNRKDQYNYGRVSNPTARILEDKIAALEHGLRAYSFGSGMAAASTAVLSVCNAGSHIVCVRNAYGPLYDMISGYCTEQLGMSVTFVSGESLQEFEDAVTDQTDLIILESPVSVIFTVQDLAGVAAIAKKHHAITYIDNTYCTPIYQNPLDMGMDIVMHTMSKYFGGHSDVIGGVLVLKDPELAAKIDQKREMFGGIIGPMEAWMVIRGLRTLNVRLREHYDTAMQVAEYLESHPKVRKVNYPGLKSHPQHELIMKQQSGSCGLLSFEIDGSCEQAKKLVSDLKIFKIGVSWGGFESLACMPFNNMTPKKAKEMGGDRNIIRIHCGLEGAANLIGDLAQALLNI